MSPSLEARIPDSPMRTLNVLSLIMHEAHRRAVAFSDMPDFLAHRFVQECVPTAAVDKSSNGAQIVYQWAYPGNRGSVLLKVDEWYGRDVGLSLEYKMPKYHGRPAVCKE